VDRNLKILLVAIFLFGFGFGAYFYHYPLYAKELGASPVQIGILFSLIQLWAFLVYLPGGWLAHRFELKWVMVGTWWLAAPGAIVYLLAPSWPWLILADFLVAVSFISGPAAQAYTMARAPAGREHLVFTLVYGTSFALGMVFGPLLGGFVAEAYGLRAIFYAPLVAFILSSLLVFWLQPSGGGAAGEGNLRTVLSHRGMRRLALYFSLIFLAFFLVQPFFSPLLKEVKGMDFSEIGLLGVVASMGSAVVGPFLSRIADRIGLRPALLAMLGLYVGALLALVFATGFALLAMAAFFFGTLSAVWSFSSAVVARRLEGLPAGYAFGAFNTLRAGIALPGPLLGGLMYGVTKELPFLVAAAALAAIFLYTLLRPLESSGVNSAGQGARAVESERP